MMNLVKGTEMKQVAGYVERKSMLYPTKVEGMIPSIEEIEDKLNDKLPKEGN